MNLEEWETAHRDSFSPIRQELVTSCIECGVRITGGEQKTLEKKRRQHTALHFYHRVYIERLMNSIGVNSEPLGYKLSEHLEKMQAALARQIYEEFQHYLRYFFEENPIKSRLTTRQVENLEYEVKRKWDNLRDAEKAAFLRFAKDFVDIVFPEFKAEDKDPVAPVHTGSATIK